MERACLRHVESLPTSLHYDKSYFRAVYFSWVSTKIQVSQLCALSLYVLVISVPDPLCKSKRLGQHVFTYPFINKAVKLNLGYDRFIRSCSSPCSNGNLYKWHVERPQNGWEQKQETEIKTKMFPKVGSNSHPLVSVSLKCARNRNKKHFETKNFGFFWKFCFLFLGHIIETETETVFKGVGWQFEKILEQILFLLVSVSNSYEVWKGTILEQFCIP